MDATKIDQEFEQLQTEFQDVAKTVQGLAEKMQAAEKAGDTNATEWLGDLKQVAQEVDEEQAQVQKLLLALHEFIGAAAEAHQAAAAEDKPPLFAPGHEPAGMGEEQQPAPQQQHHSFLGGMFGGADGRRVLRRLLRRQLRPGDGRRRGDEPGLEPRLQRTSAEL